MTYLVINRYPIIIVSRVSRPVTIRARVGRPVTRLAQVLWPIPRAAAIRWLFMATRVVCLIIRWPVYMARMVG